MKTTFLIIFCSILTLAGCSSTSTTKTSGPEETAHSSEAKKNSIYDGVPVAKVTRCMGPPAFTFSADGSNYMRYFTPSRCEVLFVIDKTTQNVVDMKYLFPHAFTRYGYSVKEKQCPLAQKQCLLS